jgi:hypothetical protein
MKLDYFIVAMIAIELFGACFALMISATACKKYMPKSMAFCFVICLFVWPKVLCDAAGDLRDYYDR